MQERRTCFYKTSEISLTRNVPVVVLPTEVSWRQGVSTLLSPFSSSTLCIISTRQRPSSRLTKMMTRAWGPLQPYGQGSIWICYCSGHWSVCCWFGHTTSVWLLWSRSSDCVLVALYWRSSGCPPHISLCSMCGSARLPSSIRLVMPLF